MVTLLPFVTLSSVVFPPAEEATAWNMVQKCLQTASLVLEGIIALSLALLLLEHVVLATSQYVAIILSEHLFSIRTEFWQKGEFQGEVEALSVSKEALE